MNTLKLRFLSLMLFAINFCYAQQTVTVTPPQFVSACEEFSYEVTLFAPPNTLFENGVLTYSLPEGINYLPNSLNNPDISEFDISNLNAPVFTLPSPILGSFTFQFSVSVSCEITNNQNPLQDEITIVHDNGMDTYLGTNYNQTTPLTQLFSIAIRDYTTDLVPPSGENATFDIVLGNTSNQTINENLDIEIWMDDGDGIFDENNDNFEHQFTANTNNLVAGDSLTIPDSIFFNSQEICLGFFVILKEEGNNCVCDERTTYFQLSPSVRTVTSYRCNIFTSQIGYAPIDGYTYHWSPSTHLSDSTISQPTFEYDGDENPFETTMLLEITRPAGCVTVDTFHMEYLEILVEFDLLVGRVCHGDSATVEALAPGNWDDYNVSWEHTTNTDAIQSGLTTGNYRITLTDDTGCGGVFNFGLPEIPPMEVNLTGTNLECGNDNSGEIEIITSGGIGDHDYNWNIDPTGGNLAAGDYYVTVTDEYGCTIVDSITLTEPPVLEVMLTGDSLECANDNSGNIEIMVSGGTSGTGDYNFNWNIDPSGGNLAADTYIVTVTDDNGCTISDTITLSEPPPLEITLTGDSLQCYNDNTGEVSIVVNGGIEDYTYQWNEDPTGGNLAAGIYEVTVTDENNCTISDAIELTQPDSLYAMLTGKNLQCFNDNSGEVSIEVFGGTEDYNFNWNIDPTGNNLAVGTYQVTVVDQHQCTFSDSVELTQPDSLYITLTGTDLECFEDNSGEISVEVFGGIEDYDFNWNINPTGGNLAADTYEVTVTDDSLCQTTASIILSEPLEINFSIISEDPLCNGGSNGQISIDFPPNANYLFSIDGINFQSSPIFENLPTGEYTIIIQDENECIKSQTVTLSDPPLLSVELLGTNLMCYNDSSGLVDINITGGTGNYIQNWNTDPSGGNLDAGTYTVTVTDDNLCQATDSIILDPPPEIDVSVTGENPLCNSESSGQISIEFSPNANYLFSIDGINFQSSPIFENLPAGEYIVITQDENECTKSQTIILDDPPILSVELLGTNLMCFEDQSGNIDIVITGGTVNNYSQNWNIDPSGGNLAADTYDVTITDGNLCQATASITLDQPPEIDVSIVSENPLCNGDNSGLISIVFPPNANYLFSIDGINFQSSPIFENLPAGEYMVITQGENECTESQTVTLSDPPLLSIELLGTNLMCYNDSSGVVDINIAGGTGNYIQNWNTDPFGGNLDAGTYTVTITDDNLCQAIDSIILSQPLEINVSVTGEDPLCNGESSGQISINFPSTANYQFSIDSSSFQSSPIFENLPAGEYLIVTQDENECTESQTVILGEPNPLLVELIGTNLMCFEDQSGNIDINITGGIGNHFQNWNIDPSGGNLTADTYTVTVTDDNLCQTSSSIMLSQPPEIDASAIGENLNCNGDNSGQISIDFPSTANYQFSINGNGFQSSPIFENLPAGEYLIVTQDENECTESQTVILVEPNPLLVELIGTNLTCFEDQSGNIDIDINGGMPPYTFEWDNPNGGGLNLPAGLYSLTLTDNNNCTAQENITLTQPPPIDIDIEKQDITCENDDDGTIFILEPDGNGFTYSLDGVNWQEIPVFNNLEAGAYDLVVSYDSGCTDSELIILTEPTGTLLTAPPDTTLNLGDSILLKPTYGHEIVDVFWDPEVFLSCDTCFNSWSKPLKTTEYIITATTASGCIVSDRMLIRVQKEVYAPNIFSPNNDGINDFFTVYTANNIGQIDELLIFDRWGDIVMKKNDFPPNNPNLGWDGTYRGKDMNPGVFVYLATISFPNGEQVMITGDVTIIR